MVLSVGFLKSKISLSSFCLVSRVRLTWKGYYHRCCVLVEEHECNQSLKTAIGLYSYTHFPTRPQWLAFFELGTRLSLHQGDVIVETKSTLQWLYMVLEGEVRLFSHGRAYHLGAHRFFNVGPFLLGSPSEEEVSVSSSEATLLRVDPQRFRSFMLERPDVVGFFFRYLSTDLQEQVLVLSRLICKDHNMNSKLLS